MDRCPQLVRTELVDIFISVIKLMQIIIGVFRNYSAKTKTWTILNACNYHLTDPLTNTLYSLSNSRKKNTLKLRCYHLISNQRAAYRAFLHNTWNKTQNTNILISFARVNKCVEYHLIKLMHFLLNRKYFLRMPVIKIVRFVYRIVR